MLPCRADSLVCMWTRFFGLRGFLRACVAFVIALSLQSVSNIALQAAVQSRRLPDGLAQLIIRHLGLKYKFTGLTNNDGLWEELPYSMVSMLDCRLAPTHDPFC